VNAEARELLDRGFDRQTRAEQALQDAVVFYERAVDADPSLEKAHYQLVGAFVALGRSHDAVARYERRLAEQPDLLSHRCLAQAYVGAGRWDEARRTIAAGLALAPRDAFLLEQEGELLARTGRMDDALAAWQRALDADPSSIGGHYSRAFLLERLGRRDEAVAEWRAIVDWCRERGYAEDLEWPRHELGRLGDDAAI
jgi:tetratricopeptide (TPR) repeat protein